MKKNQYKKPATVVVAVVEQTLLMESGNGEKKGSLQNYQRHNTTLNW